MVLGVGALSIPGAATGAARPSLKGSWQAKAGYPSTKYYPDMLRFRIGSLRNPVAASTYVISTYDGSPGSFSSPDCKITLRYTRRSASKYYFKGRFKNLGLGCPVGEDSAHTVVMRRSGSRLIFKMKADGGVYTSSMKRR